MAVVAVSWSLIADDKTYPIYVADPEKYPRAAGKANSWFQPIGPEPGRGWVLMARGDVLEILDLDSDTQKDLHLRITESSLDGETEGADEEIVGVMIWRATSVLGQGSPDDDQMLMLVELVGPEWLVEQGSVIAKAFNVRNAAAGGSDDADFYFTDTIDDDSPYSYDSLCQAIWDGEATDDQDQSLQKIMQTEDSECEWPGLGDPYSVVGNPNDYIFPGVNRWQALHVVLNHLFLSTARNPFTGEFSIAELGAEQEDLDDAEQEYEQEGRLIYDSMPQLNYILVNPGLASVAFNRNVSAYGDASDDEWDGTLVTQAVQVNITQVDDDGNVTQWGGTGDVEYGKSKQGGGFLYTTVYDDLPGFYNTDDTATIDGAATNYQDRTGHLNSALIQALEADCGRRVYSGFCSKLLPGEQIKAVWFRDWGDGFFTETLKYYGLPKRLVGPTGELSLDKQHEWGLGENLAPPDIGRPGIRTIPRMLQIVSSNGDSYGTGSCNGGSCWVQSVGGGNVAAGTYLGRLSGGKSGTYVDGDGDTQTLNGPIFTVCPLGGLTCTTVVTSVGGAGISTTTKNVPAGGPCSS